MVFVSPGSPDRNENVPLIRPVRLHPFIKRTPAPSPSVPSWFSTTTIMATHLFDPVHAPTALYNVCPQLPTHPELNAIAAIYLPVSHLFRKAY